MPAENRHRVETDTIYALSSGAVPSGVAIIRLSGPAVRFALETMTGGVPDARRARLASLRHPDSGELIDSALVLFFTTPASFTGEDVAEFHVHGGRAVVAALLAALACLPGCRPAEPGEFTRRAFEGGRLDLVEVEGLADLIAAETESQRRQALNAARGGLSQRADAWRSDIIKARAAIEADLDFADEEDVPATMADAARTVAATLRDGIAAVLAEAGRGERVRDGLQVVLLGPPNAGKSSLLNAIARRDVAIVTAQPGTTRDVMEAHLDLDGYAVTLIDTAGLRQAADEIEAEGIRRGRARAGAADLIIWLDDRGRAAPDEVRGFGADILTVASKADLGGGAGTAADLAVSVNDPASLRRLIDAIAGRAAASLGREPALVTRARQRRCLEAAVAALTAALTPGLPEEIVADHLRAAGDAVGRLSGRIDVEDVLGDIFSSFCIGK